MPPRWEDGVRSRRKEQAAEEEILVGWESRGRVEMEWVREEEKDDGRVETQRIRRLNSRQGIEEKVKGIERLGTTPKAIFVNGKKKYW